MEYACKICEIAILNGDGKNAELWLSEMRVSSKLQISSNAKFVFQKCQAVGIYKEETTNLNPQDIGSENKLDASATQPENINPLPPVNIKLDLDDEYLFLWAAKHYFLKGLIRVSSLQ